MTALKVVFLLDTTNVRQGQALAGTPARTIALATHLHRAGAAVTLVLCDRGADYGQRTQWPVATLLVHPSEFGSADALAAHLNDVNPEFLVSCEAEHLLTVAAPAASAVGARLVYDMHDDDAAVARGCGEPEAVAASHARTQQAALKRADHVVVSTVHEERLARRHRHADDEIFTAPNGVDTPQRTLWGSDLQGPATLTFLGNLFYQPNADAVRQLCDWVLPGLESRNVAAQLRVIGNAPSSFLHEPRPCVRFTGRVDDLDAALASTSLAVAPLRAGSGAKMKVLDYLAAGLPVLATDHAVTGLPPRHPGVIVENDLRAWPERINGLLQAPAVLAALSEQGRRCAEDHLSWSLIATRLLRGLTIWHASTPAPARHSAQPRATSQPRWQREHRLQPAALTSPRRAHWLRRTSPARPDMCGSDT